MGCGSGSPYNLQRRISFLGVFPAPVELVQRQAIERSGQLHSSKSGLESIACPAQGELPVDAEMTGQVDDREQDIAHLRLGLGWIGEDRLELVDFLSDLGQDLSCL